MPRPQKHVFVCTQMRPPGHPRGCCAAHNGGAVFDEFLWHLQQRNLFNEIQVTATGCLGPCNQGPTVLVYPEGVMYARVNKEDVAKIIDEHLLKNQPVTALKMPSDFWE